MQLKQKQKKNAQTAFVSPFNNTNVKEKRSKENCKDFCVTRKSNKYFRKNWIVSNVRGLSEIPNEYFININKALDPKPNVISTTTSFHKIV